MKPKPKVFLVKSKDVLLITYAIYKNPSDYPGRFVLRKWIVLKGETNPAAGAFPVCVGTLEECRAALPAGLHRIVPKGGDPVIVEEWV